MPHPLVETRSVLAPYVGDWRRCRGVAMRDALNGSASTFVCRLDAWIGGWVRVATHAWVSGDRLCRTWGRGVEMEFDALIRHYTSNDPETGATLDRYGLCRPGRVTVIGPAALNEFVGELVAVWGWNAVADAVEAAHGG